jgi:hypothetical protein
MNRASLETRMVSRLLTGITVYLLLFSLALGLLLAHGLVAEFDRELIARAEAIVEIARQELADQGGAVDPVPSFEGLRLGLFALWLSDGTLVGRPDALEALDLAVDQRLSDAPRFANLKLPDGRRGRKVEIDFVPRGEHSRPLLPSQVTVGSGVRTATLVVAEPRAALDRQILRVALLVAGGCALLLAALVLLVRTSLHRGLEPVVGLRRQVELLTAQRTVHRVSLQDPPAELAPVLQGINELLQGREQARRDREAAAGMARAS